MKKMFRKCVSKLRGNLDLEKLKKRGLKVGENFKLTANNMIDPSHCWHIEIGNNVILAPGAHILAHDASTGLFLGYTKIGNVKIGNNVFIGAKSVVLMGVTIGDNVIIGAGSIVSNDIASNSVAFGNPARVFCSLDEYLSKEKAQMTEGNTFEENYTLRNPNFTMDQRNELIEACKIHKTSYIR